MAKPGEEGPANRDAVSVVGKRRALILRREGVYTSRAQAQDLFDQVIREIPGFAYQKRGKKLWTPGALWDASSPSRSERRDRGNARRAEMVAERVALSETPVSDDRIRDMWALCSGEPPDNSVYASFCLFRRKECVKMGRSVVPERRAIEFRRTLKSEDPDAEVTLIASRGGLTYDQSFKVEEVLLSDLNRVLGAPVWGREMFELKHDEGNRMWCENALRAACFRFEEVSR